MGRAGRRPRVDLATGDGLDATARAQALAEGIPQREAEIRALARSVLQSSTVRGAVTGGRYWREVPVAAIVDGVTVEGFVDLLIETLEGLVVVDYKTDQTPTDDDIDAAMERYCSGRRLRPRARAGARRRYAASSCSRAPARRREVDDLPAAIAAVERRGQLLDAALGRAPGAPRLIRLDQESEHREQVGGDVRVEGLRAVRQLGAQRRVRVHVVDLGSIADTVRAGHQRSAGTPAPRRPS